MSKQFYIFQCGTVIYSQAPPLGKLISGEKHLSAIYIIPSTRISNERIVSILYGKACPCDIEWLRLACIVVNSKIYFHLLLHMKPVYPASQHIIRKLMCLLWNSGIVGFSSWTCAHRKPITRIQRFFWYHFCVNFFSFVRKGKGKKWKKFKKGLFAYTHRGGEKKLFETCVLVCAEYKRKRKFSRDISVKDTHLDIFGKFQRTKLFKTREIEREWNWKIEAARDKNYVKSGKISLSLIIIFCFPSFLSSYIQKYIQFVR